MEKNRVFEKNLSALSGIDPELCSQLSKAAIKKERYTFQDSRSGELIPAIIDSSGTSRPLHSMMDPRKEARRLIDSSEHGSVESNSTGGECFIILLGLGAGYYAEAALEKKNVSKVLVIDFDVNSVAELFSRLDYTRLINNPRFRLFIDISETELKEIILNTYQPVLSGGIRVIPLRPRTTANAQDAKDAQGTQDAQLFTQAAGVISAAIDKVSADYSVQAHFGRRWFSNIIRNLRYMNEIKPLPSVDRVAVTAAGPSLTLQMGKLREERAKYFLIATDTSLPCLLHANIIPDAVISIDCQHISYYHFMEGLPQGIPLYLDLASPPLLSSLTKERHFFSCGHPLTRYISQICGGLSELDSSGGNVTYAAISLAEKLGAKQIDLYGADYSYPMGISYAKGSYIYSYFEKRANRFSPMEAQASAFLFRTPLEKKVRANSWYYETKTMTFYREKLEEKSKSMNAALVPIIPIEGMGAPIQIKQNENLNSQARRDNMDERAPLKKPNISAKGFLSSYKDDIKKLPKPEINAADYLSLLNKENQAVFTSLLPLAATIKYRHPGLGFSELLEEVKAYCLKKININ